MYIFQHYVQMCIMAWYALMTCVIPEKKSVHTPSMQGFFAVVPPAPSTLQILPTEFPSI